MSFLPRQGIQIQKFQMGRKPTRHSRKPSFFKVLLGDFSEQLRIPRGFIKHVNGKLPGNFNIRSPNGTNWCVKVKKIKDGWFFRSGWNRFVKYHSLQVGDFLVFTYEGDLEFSVTIFDRSACEKEIPLAKKRRNDDVGEEIKPQELGSKAITQFIKKAVQPRGSVKQNERISDHKIRINGKLESVRLLETDRPHLTQIWKPSLRYQITFPRALVVETGLIGKERVLLWDPQGRSWPVKLYLRQDERVQIRTGWSEFWRGNNLVTGDVFVFEFLQEGTRDGDHAVYVHIFRAAAENLEPITSDLMPHTATMATTLVENGETRAPATSPLQVVQLLE